MIELELEKTYLAKYLPDDLASCRSELLSTTYFPVNAAEPHLRLRKRGDRLELTKKLPVSGTDSSRQHEHTIALTPEEYAVFEACPGKKATKRRYYCQLGGRDAEVDVYLDDLAGLVVIDFEFENDEAMDAFVAPDICLVDVTQDLLIAGGILAGRTYESLQQELETTYKYKPLYTEINTKSVEETQ